MTPPLPPPICPCISVWNPLFKHKLGDVEKQTRAINKRLRDIEVLAARAGKGEKLDEQQLAKLGRLDSTLAELEALLTGG